MRIGENRKLLLKNKNRNSGTGISRMTRDTMTGTKFRLILALVGIQRNLEVSVGMGFSWDVGTETTSKKENR